MKRSIKSLLSIVLLILPIWLQSCSSDPDDEIKETLELETDELNFTNNSETKTVQLKSNARWRIICDQEWCTVEPSEGSKDEVLDIFCTANTEAEERKATITIVTEKKTQIKEIEVRQLGSAPAIIITPKTQTAPQTGGSFYVEITANVEFETLFPDNWIRESALGRSVESSFKHIEVLPNEGDDERKGKVIFKQVNGIKADTLYVTQRGKGFYIEADYDTRNLGPEETLFSITVAANVEFETHIQDSWIQQVTARADIPVTEPVGDVLLFTVHANTGKQERSTRIIFKQKDALLADTVIVKQSGEIDLSGKNLAKSIIEVNAQGLPLVSPYRNELYFNYDAQNRITWVKQVKEYYEEGIISDSHFTARIVYNSNNEMERLEYLSDFGGINNSIELVESKSNSLTYKIMHFENGIKEEVSRVKVSLNSQKQITDVDYSDSRYIYRYSYDSNSSLTKFEALLNNVTLGYLTYQYDNKKGILSASGQPMHALWLLETDTPLWFIKNNPVSMTINEDGSSYSYSMNYEYNAHNFPIKATVTVPGKTMWYIAEYY